MSGKVADVFLVVADGLAVFIGTVVEEGSRYRYCGMLRWKIFLQQADSSPRTPIHGALHS